MRTPSWVKISGKEDFSLQGTAREEMMSLSLSTYYGNLDFYSSRGGQKLDCVDILTSNTGPQIEKLLIKCNAGQGSTESYHSS